MIKILYLFSNEQKAKIGSHFVYTKGCWVEFTDVINADKFEDFDYKDVQIVVETDDFLELSSEYPIGEKVGIPLHGGFLVIQSTVRPPEEFFEELRSFNDISPEQVRIMLADVLKKYLKTDFNYGGYATNDNIEEKIGNYFTQQNGYIEKSEAESSIENLFYIPLEVVQMEYRQVIRDVKLKIDEALDNGDEELFKSLSKQYEYLILER